MPATLAQQPADPHCASKGRLRNPGVAGLLSGWPRQEGGAEQLEDESAGVSSQSESPAAPASCLQGICAWGSIAHKGSQPKHCWPIRPPCAADARRIADSPLGMGAPASAAAAPQEDSPKQLASAASGEASPQAQPLGALRIAGSASAINVRCPCQRRPTSMGLSRGHAREASAMAAAGGPVRTALPGGWELLTYHRGTRKPGATGKFKVHVAPDGSKFRTLKAAREAGFAG